MKKLFLILATFIGLLNNVSAQISLEEGPIVVKSGLNVPRKILGKNDKYFFVLRTNLQNKKNSIEKYAIADMSLVSVTDITIENGGKKFIVLKDAFYLNGKILVFRTSTDHKEGKLILFLQTISEDGIIDKDLLEVYNIKITPLYKMVQYEQIWEYNYANYAEFHFSQSSDNKKLLIIDEEIKKADGGTIIEKISSKFLDVETMTVKGEKEIPNQYKETKIYPWNYKVDGSENVYFIYNYFNSDKKSHTAIGLVSPNSSSIVGMDINVDRAKYKIDALDYLINDNSIYCNGIYKTKTDKKEKEKSNQMQLFGVFSQKINAHSFKTEQFDMKPFTEDIVQKLRMSEKTMNKKHGVSDAFNNFKVDHIKIINNEVYTIAQLYYPYSALFIFKINVLGKTEWMTSINNNFRPKKYYSLIASLEGNPCYYHAFTTMDNLYFIFNENPENLKVRKGKNLYDLELSNYKSYAAIKGTNVICAKIDKTGTVERNVIFKNENHCLLFLPKVAHFNNYTPFPLNNSLILPITNNQILVYLKQDKGKYMKAFNTTDEYGKITLK